MTDRLCLLISPLLDLGQKTQVFQGTDKRITTRGTTTMMALG